MALRGIGADFCGPLQSLPGISLDLLRFQFFYLSWDRDWDRVTLASEISPQPRLFTVCLGESADDRKSESIKRTVNLFEDSLTKGSLKLCHGVGSSEGLTKILDEGGGSDRKLLFVYDELKSFVGKATIEGSTLLPAVATLKGKNWYTDIIFQGQRKREKIGKKDDAQKVLNKRLSDLTPEDHGMIKDEKVTLEEFAKEYLIQKENSTRPSTYIRDEVSVNLHLVPYFGKEYLFNITPHKIFSYQSKKLSEGF